jgi:hypothetical protein
MQNLDRKKEVVWDRIRDVRCSQFRKLLSVEGTNKSFILSKSLNNKKYRRWNVRDLNARYYEMHKASAVSCHTED